MTKEARKSGGSSKKNEQTAVRMAQFFEEVLPDEELSLMMEQMAAEFVAEGKTNYAKLLHQWNANGYERIATKFDTAMKRALQRSTN